MHRRFLRLLKILFAALAILAGSAYFLLWWWPLRTPHPAPQVIHGVLAIRNVRVLASPDASVIERGTVLVRDGVIAAVGPEVPIPEWTQVLTCEGCTVLPGF